MVTLRESTALGGVGVASNIPISPFQFTTNSSFGRSLSSTSPNTTTTTQFFNVLSASDSDELTTTVQHYNDITRNKNINLSSKNINREEISPSMVRVFAKDSSKFGSFLEARASTSSFNFEDKITNSKRAMELRNLSAMENEQYLNIIKEDNTECNSTPRRPSLQKSQAVIIMDDQIPEHTSSIFPNKLPDPPKSHNNTNVSRALSLKEKFLSTRQKLSIRDRSRKIKVNRTFSLVPSNFRRNKFWSTINKSSEQSQKKRPDSENKANNVPKLHIWLSTDQAPRELDPNKDQNIVLNNTRENKPRIQLEYPRVMYRSASEGTRWRNDSTANNKMQLQFSNVQHGPGQENGHNGRDAPKSPMGKQPTWPLSNTQFLLPRPKLIHQENVKLQTSKRAEFGRQDAVMEETAQGRIVKKADDVDWQSSLGSTDFSASSPGRSTPPPVNDSNTLSPYSIAAPHPRLLKPSRSLSIASRFFRRKSSADRPPLRSVSDDKSEISASEYSWRSDSILSDVDDDQLGYHSSVFSMNRDESPNTATSWASSNVSLHRQDTANSNRYDRRGSENRLRPLHPPVQSSNSLQIFKQYRSNSASERSGSTRLTVPGDNKSRRPSLLSLRSLSKSPIPYISMDYDPEFDYEQIYYHGGSYYHTHGGSFYAYGTGPIPGLVPEPPPKLTLTQRLAFPTLVQNSLDRPRPRDPFSEENNGMNTAAKLITVMVLTLVIVLVVVGIYRTFR